ncbi:hypothetical protein [Alkalimonas mucilaginosa]|uniref:Uncharacterized protein n=1 Tax=Alkalimonas mucilaginosa TaxID=3057676 RepID=A0ABU7JK97_9GAMM|nr:hypothetical protein [Alkalimonas sp. MEB004]MEE2026126.1 hypothetical protein [Alkalimonas sp. MEB004]
MKLHFTIAALFTLAVTFKLAAADVSTPSVVAPTQRHLTELLAYFDEPRFMENIVVVGWLCTASIKEQEAYTFEFNDSTHDLENFITLNLFTKGLFLTKEDCPVVEINEKEDREFNYSNGITLKINREQVAQLRELSGQLVTLRGDYFSWHNVISMESSFKSGVLQVKVMAAGNQRFQGAFGPIKEKE